MTDSAYKQAGVDIEAAYELVSRIKPHVKKTNRPGVMSGLGGFGALFDLKATGYQDPILVSATDGVGTKLKIAIELDRHDTIGIDAVAMCVNDLVVQGAEPLFFLDYFATGKLVNNVAETVIAGIAEGCQQAGCALLGGETAEMPGMYAPGEYDIAGFTVGAVERDQMITGAEVAAGDVILGLSSNGVHSNGFSLVRKLIKTADNFTYETRAPFDDSLSLGELILMPTRIYVRSILKALEIKNDQGKATIKGMAHITGGGLYENIPRSVPDNLIAHVDASSWELPTIFRWLAQLGALDLNDMANTFNCGVGMAVICAPEHADALKTVLEEQGERVYQIGHITERGDHKEPIVLENIESWK